MATRIKSKFKTGKDGWNAKLTKPAGVSEKYSGSYISGSLGGVKVGNNSLKKYYGKEFMPPKIKS